MIKLYKRHSDGTVDYHEAWIDGRTIIEHWGKAGTQGETRIHSIKSRATQSELERVLQGARREGFAEVDLDEHRRLLVEYPIHGMGTTEDLDKRHRLEDVLNETLGWTGLGMCDGGSIGSGTMEVCCFVVEFPTAKSAVEASLAGTEFSNFSRIYDEDADCPPQNLIDRTRPGQV